MNKTKFLLSLVMLFSITNIFAYIPVINGKMINNSSELKSTSETPSTQLQQKTGSLENLNLPTRLNQLEQTVKDLRTLIIAQGDELKQLEIQQSNLNASLNKTSNTNFSQSPKPIYNIDKSKNITSSKEYDDYQSAFDLIKKKQYSQANSALSYYIKQYPNGKYISNAYYWLGELYMIAGQNAQATNTFTLVQQNYPDSEKASDALLKLGNIAQDGTHWEQANRWWQKLVNQYPNSSAARIAETKLRNLQIAGH